MKQIVIDKIKKHLVSLDISEKEREEFIKCYNLNTQIFYCENCKLIQTRNYKKL